MKIPKDITKYQNKYSESSFWNKVRSAAKKAGANVIYSALVLHFVLHDSNTSLKDKGLIIGALGYFILPVDLIPDTIPFVGYTDDLKVLLDVCKTVMKNITPNVKRNAKDKLQQWFGDVNEKDLILY